MRKKLHRSTKKIQKTIWNLITELDVLFKADLKNAIGFFSITSVFFLQKEDIFGYNNKI